MHHTRACSETHKEIEKILPLRTCVRLGETTHWREELKEPDAVALVFLYYRVLCRSDLWARFDAGYFLSAHGFHHVCVTCDTGQQHGTGWQLQKEECTKWAKSPQGTNRHIGASETLLTGCGRRHGEGSLVGDAVFIRVLLWTCAFVGLWPWRVGRGTRWHGQSWGDFSHYEGKSSSVINKAYTRIKKLFWIEF